jgi:hypothetical protein
MASRHAASVIPGQHRVVERISSCLTREWFASCELTNEILEGFGVSTHMLHILK